MHPVTLDNWLEADSIGWSLQHVPELVATTAISRGIGPPRSLRGQGAGLDLGDFCARTYTDALIVIRGDTVLHERYFGEMTPATRHIVMSVSKSVAGLVAGTTGIDVAGRVSHYIPELTDGPYGTATVEDLLNMTVTLRYDMDHTDPDSEVAAEDRAAGWRPRRPGDPAGGSHDFLRRLRSAPDNDTFQYSSATTEVLGWVLERAAGTPYPQLVSEALWSRMGAAHDAFITVDEAGTGYACAGIGMTLRDLARFGRLILDGGSYDGSQVIPEEWIKQTFAGGDPAVTADHPFRDYLAEGSYRNQWWITGYGPIYASGLLGQYLWLDPARDIVIAKFSSIPVELDQRAEHVRGFQHIAQIQQPLESQQPLETL
jgi:CubicO group peptidase (beta-lactamase class C family)